MRQIGRLRSVLPIRNTEAAKTVTNAGEIMTCPEYNAADNTCGVDGFKFYQGMQKPCESPGITKDKCPRFAMK